MMRGDSEASAGFCVAIHPDVKTLNSKLAVAGGFCVFGNDDGYALGPEEVVFAAVDTFASSLHARCNLTLQPAKTEVFTSTGLLPANTPAGFKRAGVELDGFFHPGFMCYGIPIGSNEFVRHMLMEKVREISKSADMACQVLHNDSQALWAILRSSLAQQLDYHLSLCYPSDIKSAATHLDGVLCCLHWLSRAGAAFPVCSLSIIG